MSAEQRCRDYLARAEKRAPDNSFVRSCRRQFETQGFLSPKQLGALARIKKPAATPLGQKIHEAREAMAANGFVFGDAAVNEARQMAGRPPIEEK